MIREMSRFLRYGSIAVELNPVRQKAQLMRSPESEGHIATMSVSAGLQFGVQTFETDGLSRLNALAPPNHGMS